MSKFTLFDEALSALSAYASPMNPYHGASQPIINGIRQGQRFFVPYGGGPIANRKFSDFYGTMRLPYPVTVVAAEAEMEDAEDSITWIIVCRQGVDDVGFDFHIAVKNLDLKGTWLPVPKGNVSVGDEGLRFTVYDSFLARQLAPGFSPSRTFGPIVSSVVALCVMLSLQNVKTESIDPSPAMNAKRKAKGKRPLYSYKILNVDGERWESNGCDTGDGQGYRSHLRRGHIRRLSDDRAVWVRATYVHGRMAGFVDKDYNVSGNKQEEHANG